MFARAARSAQAASQARPDSDSSQAPSLAEVAARLSSSSQPIVFRNDHAAQYSGDLSDHDNGGVERVQSTGNSAGGSGDNTSEEEPFGDEFEDDEDIDDEDVQDGEEYDDEEDEEEDDVDDDDSSSSHSSMKSLREISSLASWTVSSHKPGCGVASLRHQSTAQYWQSDGPQPHALTLHFIKKVEVVRLRVYLDFDVDESYTPTKMSFLAGMGGNDFVEFATWQGDAPRGWVDINLDNVGGQPSYKTDGSRGERWWRSRSGRKSKSKKNTRMHEDAQPHRRRDRGSIEMGHDGTIAPDEYSSDDVDDPYGDADGDESDSPTGSILKAMVIQMKVLENHQNGKDTHVRGFQVFARDDRRAIQSRGFNERATNQTSKAQAPKNILTFDDTDWMPEPEIR